MKKTHLRVLLLLALLAGVGVWYGLREYNRPVKGAEGLRTDERITSQALYEAFDADEEAANARFAGKVLEVTGVVRSIQRGTVKTDLLLDAGDALGGVVCEFGEGAQVKAAEGNTITVKGICAGFNMDVLLQRCTLLE